MSRTIKHIVIHCTGGNQFAMPIDLMAEFAQKGWKNPGYHIVIDFMGRAHLMQPLEKVANGVKGWNLNAIHIAWIGGADGKDSRTEEQVITMKAVVKILKEKYPDAKLMANKYFRSCIPHQKQNGICNPPVL